MKELAKALKFKHLDGLHQIGHERYASSHINVIGHYDETTLFDVDGKLIQIVALHGINHHKYTDDELAVYKDRRNNFFKDLPADISIYCWTVREKINKPLLDDANCSGFAKTANDLYQAKLCERGFYVNTHYIAFIARHSTGSAANLLSKFKSTENANANEQNLSKQHEHLSETVSSFCSRFKEYRPSLLGCFEENDVTYSKPLGFLSKLINQEQGHVRLKSQNAAASLVRKRLSFNRRTGFIEISAATGEKQYSSIIAIRDYSLETFAGMLDSLESANFGFTLTQSYSPIPKDVAKKKLKSLVFERNQSDEVSHTETDELGSAAESLARFENGLGLHHFSLCLTANSLAELNEQIKIVQDKLDLVGITAIKEDIGAEAAYFAQLPGNYGYIARAAHIQSCNLSSLFSLHNSAAGKRDGNYWGRCVTVMETLTGAPYFFNIHAKDLGIALIFGVPGSGKTTLAGFLLLQTLKFGGRRIVFDKDNGLKILIKALGGAHINVNVNTPTGINPCHLEDTPENRGFLMSLFHKILSLYEDDLNEDDFEVIKDVIERMYLLPFELRRFRQIAPFFSASKHARRLQKRFDEWHSNGQYAWVFDNEYDEISLDANVIGIDVTQLMDAKGFKTPVLMYFIHRAKQALAGVRGGLIFDEGWKLLDDPYFAKTLIEDKARTGRKADDFIIFLTQETEDTVKSEVSGPLNRSATAKLFFPNPTASEEVYCGGLGLSEQGYTLVKTLSDENRFFVLDYGKNSDLEIMRLNLRGLDDLIHVISGRAKTVEILEEILSDESTSKDPKDWLPIFLERVKSL